MKKLALVLLLFVFSCQTINQFEQKPAFIDDNIIQNVKTHDQFESRDLEFLANSKKKTKVALFLPFSGKHKELGESLANSAMMSLFDNDKKKNIELVLIDSKSDAQFAKQAFEEIITNNIKIVIGPIFSETTKQIKEQADNNKITIISFSNNRELMQTINKDNGVFLSGLLPESEVEDIVSYAIKQGKTRFSILAPRNEYGNTITGLYKKLVRDKDGTFITSEFYVTNEKSLERSIDHVVNAFILDPSIKLEGDSVIKESQRQYSEVILIPESGRVLSKIMEKIKSKNTDERNFKILGSSNWDNISTLNDPKLIGSWFPAPLDDDFRKFEKTYYKNFEKFPPRLSSISYDLVLALSQVAKDKESDDDKSPITAGNLVSYQEGFVGIDGPFRFLPNGLVQRNLAILEVGNGEFNTVEKPSGRFLKY